MRRLGRGCLMLIGGVVVIVVIVVVIGVATSGGGNGGNQASNTGTSGQSNGNQAAKPKAAGIGDKVRAGDTLWVITSVKRESRMKGVLGACKPQGVWWVVEGKVTNNGDEAADLSASDVQLVDSRGRKSDASNETTGCIPNSKDLLFSSVNPGSTKQFEVAFDMPKSAHNLRLSAPDVTDVFGDSVLIDLGK